MKLKTVKSTDDYTICQRRDGRYAVKDAAGKPVNGADKVKILVAEELVKISVAAPAAAAPAETAAEAGDAAPAAAAD
jgi:hypothetical protein